MNDEKPVQPKDLVTLEVRDGMHAAQEYALDVLRGKKPKR